jgi:hypothetical protein
MTGHGAKLPRKREVAIAALLSHPTVEAAAAAARVSERTLRLWLRDPEFIAEYRTARRTVLEAATGRLQQAAGQAVDALLRNLTCGRPAAEIRAAATILQLAHQAVELVELEQRVAELEGADPRRAAL